MATALKSTVLPQSLIAQPEPGLTAEEVVARARNLRGRLLEEQEAAEVRGRYSPEMPS